MDHSPVSPGPGKETSRKRKPGLGYLAMRIWLVASIAVWIGGFILLERAQGVAEDLRVLILLAFAPVALPVFVITLYSLTAFPFSYSILGRYQRSPFPTETAIVQRSSGGYVGAMRQVSYFSNTWTVYPSGLGVSMLLENFFLPKDQIVHIREGLIFYVVIHKSPEARSPIRFRSKEVYDALVGILQTTDT